MTDAVARSQPSRLRSSIFAALVTLAAVVLSGTPGAGTSPADATVRVIVEAVGGVDGARAAIAGAGGRIHQVLAPLGMLVAEVPASQVDELEADPRTAAVTPDRPLQMQSDSLDAGAGPAVALQAIGAPEAWAAGATGRGVGVAVVDTGIDDHPDLDERVVAAFDLSGEGTPDDGYGHGTFMAGVVAGDGTASGGRYPGVAPEAHLVSIKVAGADGATTLSQVLNGLVVAERTRHEFGVRVVVLALAGPAGPGRDPLQTAVEHLWDQGLFVVVAAGNTGPDAGSVGSPGVAPKILTLGASDDAGTASLEDDTVPSWSAVGPTPDGVAKPEIVAPGARIVAARAVGSVIDEAFPNARIGEDYLRGSGTSMSAAMAAGGAAVVLQQHPTLTPDQLKARLTGTAAPLPSATDPAAAGNGSLALPAALAATDTSTGTAQPRRGSTPPPAAGTPQQPTAPQPAGWRWADGEFAGWRWADGEFAGWRWAEGDWAGWRWADGQWAGWRWAEDDWAGWRWATGEWSGWRWAGDDWSGWRWAGDEWSGWRWAGDDWSGWRWAGFVGNADTR